jgi:hypothetical protein
LVLVVVRILGFSLLRLFSAKFHFLLMIRAARSS